MNHASEKNWYRNTAVMDGGRSEQQESREA
jgi:hypothetical protein